MVLAEEDEDATNVLVFVSLVERNMDFGVVVIEDEGEECDGVGKQRPKPKAVKTVLTSNIPRVNERSAGVEQVEQEEEPKQKRERK